MTSGVAGPSATTATAARMTANANQVAHTPSQRHRRIDPVLSMRPHPTPRHRASSSDRHRSSRRSDAGQQHKEQVNEPSPYEQRNLIWRQFSDCKTLPSLLSTVQYWNDQLLPEHCQYLRRRSQALFGYVERQGVAQNTQEAEKQQVTLHQLLDEKMQDLSRWTTTELANFADATYKVPSAANATNKATTTFITIFKATPELVTLPEVKAISQAGAKVAGLLSQTDSLLLLHSLHSQPHLRQQLAETRDCASLLVDALMIAALQREQQEKRQAPSALSAEIKVELNWLAPMLYDLRHSITGTTLFRLLQAADKLRWGSVLLFRMGLTGRGAWAADAVRSMSSQEAVLAATAAANLNLQGYPLAEAILQRCRDLQDAGEMQRLKGCYQAQLARAVALLQAKDHATMCLKAALCCCDHWEELSAPHYSMLGGAHGWLHKVVMYQRGIKSQLNKEQWKAVRDKLRDQVKGQSSWTQDRVLKALMALPLNTWSSVPGSEPQAEQASSGDVTSIDIRCETAEGAVLSWQVEGMQHFVEWLQAMQQGVEAQEAAYTLEINGSTAFRNCIQSADGHILISVPCSHIEKLLEPGNEEALKVYLLKLIAAANLRHKEITSRQRDVLAGHEAASAAADALLAPK